MSKEGFLKNNRGINDGSDLDPIFMGALYDRIVGNEIKMKDFDPAASGGPTSGSKSNTGLSSFATSLLTLMGGAMKQEASTEPSDESIKRTLDYLHEKAKQANTVTVTEPEVVRPMMEVSRSERDRARD